MGERISVEHGVSWKTVEQVVECESQWNPDAYNASENSRGLVQIHKPSWPDITDEQAYDPEFALTFLASHLKEGNGDLWTCYRKMGL